MSDLVAYAPKAGVYPGQLGAVFVNDTTEVNVHDLVVRGHDGIFVVAATSPAIAKLDAYEPLKRVAVPDGESTAPDGGAPVAAPKLKKRGESS